MFLYCELARVVTHSKMISWVIAKCALKGEFSYDVVGWCGIFTMT